MSQYGDGDHCSVFENRWQTARKEHICQACHETISPGQRYHVTFYVFDGDPSQTKRCVRCQTIFEHLSKQIREEGGSEEFCDDRLNCGHEYQERWDEEPPLEVAALAFWLPKDGPPPVYGGPPVDLDELITVEFNDAVSLQAAIITGLLAGLKP